MCHDITESSYSTTLTRSVEPSAHRPPPIRCHLEQTPESAKARVRYRLAEDADELLKSRYDIINVWRSIHGPVVEFGYLSGAKLISNDVTITCTGLIHIPGCMHANS